MSVKVKKLTVYQKPFFCYILSPKRIFFGVIASIVFTIFVLVNSHHQAYAAVVINSTINFQGKVVNKDVTLYNQPLIIKREGVK